MQDIFASSGEVIAGAPTNDGGRLGFAATQVLAAGAVIEPADGDRPHGFVIESGLVAVLTAPAGAQPCCVGLLGPGMVISGYDTPARQAYHAVAQTTLRVIPAAFLRAPSGVHPSFEHAYMEQLRYRLAQAELIAACNAHHSLAGRCARWLLRFSQHLGTEVQVTHAFLGALLGVRRAGVSVALHELQQRQAIVQRRGSVVVADAQRLAAFACACPNDVTASPAAISIDDLGSELPSVRSARAWIEQAINMQRPLISDAGDEAWIRREAALRVCRAIVGRDLTGQSMLLR